MLAVIAVTALLLRLSALYLPDNKIFDPKLFFPLLFTGPITYCLLRYRHANSWASWLIDLAMACGLFSVSLPDPSPDYYVDKLFAVDTLRSDAIRLSQWHLPLVLWSLLDVAFCGPAFNSPERRLQYKAATLFIDSPQKSRFLAVTAVNADVAELNLALPCHF